LRTLFFPPVLRFGHLKQLPENICQQFARNGYQVYFCNNTLGENTFEEVERNLFVFHNYEYALEYVKNKNIKIDVMLTTWAKHYDWVDKIKPKLTIYYSCDSFNEWKPYEKLMLDKSDMVLCTAEKLQQMRKEEHNNVHLVRNATDSSLFNKDYKVINEIANLPGFKFAFVGAIGSWTSTYLMRKVAKKYPVFLVGQEFGKKCPDNVINLGLKKHEELINYYHSFDAFLLPFNTKLEVVQCACPVKLYEYMTIGKPIISTSWAETELFNNYQKIVFTSNSDEEFMENVDYVANMNQEEKDILKEKSRMFMMTNRWEDRYKQIKNIINDYIEKNNIKL